MKTSKPPVVKQISQTEALLGAIESGFFEITVERSMIKKVPSLAADEPLNVEINGSHCGNTDLVITAKGEVLFMLNRKLPKLSVGVRARQFSAIFSFSVFKKLLSQPRCSGIRFFPNHSTGPTGRIHSSVVIAGVFENGFDMGDFPGYFVGI
ncbi:MAG: hypothetical protein AAFZ15_28465 [Bacteroidota bacterium]